MDPLTHPKYEAPFWKEAFNSIAEMRHRLNELEIVVAHNCTHLQAAAKGQALVIMVIRYVAEWYDLDPNLLRSRLRTANVVRVRQVSMYLAHRFTAATWSDLGRWFQRDHGTIMWGVETVRNRIATQPAFNQEILALQREIESLLAIKSENHKS